MTLTPSVLFIAPPNDRKQNFSLNLKNIAPPDDRKQNFFLNLKKSLARAVYQKRKLVLNKFNLLLKIDNLL